MTFTTVFQNIIKILTRYWDVFLIKGVSVTLALSAITVFFGAILGALLALQTGKIDALAVAHGNGEAIIANNPDIAFTGYDFEVDPKYENNVILLNKNSTDLLKKVNEALAKALAANLYDGWYNDAKALAGISTAAEISYNDDGTAPTN